MRWLGWSGRNSGRLLSIRPVSIGIRNFVRKAQGGEQSTAKFMQMQAIMAAVLEENWDVQPVLYIDMSGKHDLSEEISLDRPFCVAKIVLFLSHPRKL